MAVRVIKLDANQHAAFLAERRRDPLTKEVFKAGDEVVVSAQEKVVFLKGTWDGLGGAYKGSSRTLDHIPEFPSSIFNNPTPRYPEPWNLTRRRPTRPQPTATQTRTNTSQNPSQADNRNSTVSRSNTGWKWFGWIAVLIAIILGIALIYSFNENGQIEAENTALRTELSVLEGKNNYLQANIDSMEAEKKSITQKITDLSDSVEKMTPVIREFPLAIKDVRVINRTQEGHSIQEGLSFKKHLVKYLGPTFRLTNHSENPNIQVLLFIRFISEEGDLKTHSGSPPGFTLERTITLPKVHYSKEYSLGGIGRPSGGSFNYGNWLMEIWYDDKCLGSKKFKIE